MESVTRRSILAGATGAAAVGFANQVLGQDAKQRSAESGGQDCLCTIQIPDLNTSELSTRGESQSRDLIGALAGVLVPIIVEEIVKATRSRGGVTASARGVDAKELAASRDGQRGVDEQTMRGLFSGSFSGPGIKIGVVIG